jgi:hypothetical protein
MPLVGPIPYYFHLQKAVEEALVGNHRIGAKDLLMVLDSVPDPPLGCDPLPKPANWYSGDDEEDHFKCPLRPMTIRRRLQEIASSLGWNNDQLMGEFFGEDFASG